MALTPTTDAHSAVPAPAIAPAPPPAASAIEAVAPSGVRGFFEERLSLKSLRYPIPGHANRVWYTLGGVAFLLFLVEIVTGIWLAQFYHPDPTQATDSVAYITTTQSYGDLVRGIHYWNAFALIALVVLHLIRVFVTASYKRPRELNWLVGLALLAVTFGFAYSGTVIKWDQEGSEALAHNEAVAHIVGRMGGWFSADFSLHVPLLTRVYFAHIAIFPGLLTVWLIAHFYLIKVHGMAPLWRRKGAAAAEAEAGAPANRYGEAMLPYTSHVRHMLGWGLLVFGIVAGLAAAFVPPLGPKPVQGIEVTRPPVYFWPFYGAEDLFGVKGGLLWFPLVLFGLLTGVLLIDRGPARSPAQRKWLLLAGAVVILVLVGLGVYARVSTPKAHTQM